MNFTNKYGLPAAFVRAVENDPYNNGGADFTPSSLDNTPLSTALLKEFGNQAECDVSNRVDAIIGSGAHYVAQRAQRPGIDLCEERFFSTFTVDGTEHKISAAIDIYETDTCHLIDWKTTKAYAFSRKAGGGKKPSWKAQMNIGAELLRRHSHIPKRLSIIAMLKDWSPHQAGTAACPEQQVIDVDIPLWTSDEVSSHISERVRLHTSATTSMICSKVENWNGNRCARWCDANSVCPQYQKAKQTGLIGG